MLYGAEIEKTIIGPDGMPGRMSTENFLHLLELFNRHAKPHYSDIAPNRVTGVDSEIGSLGLDNGITVQESALGPVSNLEELRQLCQRDLELIASSLGDQKIIDLARYPWATGKVDWDFYRANVAPKGIYPILWERGWDHTSGFEGQTQNSPSTGIGIEKAAIGVSVMYATDPAISAIFGNSPRFDEQGRMVVNTSRPEMWDTMFKGSKVKGDRRMSEFPEKPFLKLSDYFNWIWGEGTGMFFVFGDVEEENDGYKGIGNSAVLVEGNPSVLKFLESDKSSGYFPSDYLPEGFPWENKPKIISPTKIKRKTEIIPTLEGVQHLQFMTFGPARWRFLVTPGVDPKEFSKACAEGGDVESLLSPNLINSYIEGRTPCANFPSRYHADLGEGVRQSVVISPSAIQAGLLNNPDANFKQILSQYSWEKIVRLRTQSMVKGLEDDEVYKFSQFVFGIAADGLANIVGHKEAEQLLQYPQLVIETRRNGSTRANELIQEELRNKRLKDAFISLLDDRRLII